VRECKTCIYREYKDKLVCCAANHVGEAFRDLLRSAIPRVPAYECKAYEPDPTAIVDQTIHERLHTRVISTIKLDELEK
jgi:hypothetical protein